MVGPVMVTQPCEVRLNVSFLVLHQLVIQTQHIFNQVNMADSRFALSQWETSLQSNTVSHWLRANLESVSNSRFASSQWETSLQSKVVSHWLGENFESAVEMKPTILYKHFQNYLCTYTHNCGTAKLRYPRSYLIEIYCKANKKRFTAHLAIASLRPFSPKLK